jgi:hypothetical protein
MSDDACVSMMLCVGIEPDEQEKVERLDRPISETLYQAGYEVRICQGRTDGGYRLLNFYGLKEIVSISAEEFLAASDSEAVDLIARSCPYRLGG